MLRWVLGLGLIAVACGGDGGRADTTSTVGTTASTSVTTSSSTTSLTTGESGSGSGDATSDATSGSAGTVADSGDTMAPDEVACAYHCTAASDCLVDGMGSHTCQSGKCVVACTTDESCVAYFSGWMIEPCQASTDCDLGTCIVFEDTSGCAFTPDVVNCADLGLVEIQRMTTEGVGVTVCAEPDGKCVDLGAGTECIVPCADFVECYTKHTGEVCTPQGECVYACVEDGDCPASTFDNVVAACE